MGDFNSGGGEGKMIYFAPMNFWAIHTDFLEQESNEIRTEFLRNSVSLKRENSDKTVNTYGTQMTEFCR